ncbi:hypothetical protein L1987_39205 [Smallanthus sonchifolius]|uniref:Uncharacterized protein n=1 Tax=Smallanthus sonchifolius TaxID=185202 RepID=A0ACB9HMK2_9ASTR|nr:hypothetical protein L1987_39205 [Smallanthus sonchifolius]
MVNGKHLGYLAYGTVRCTRASPRGGNDKIVYDNNLLISTSSNPVWLDHQHLPGLTNDNIDRSSIQNPHLGQTIFSFQAYLQSMASSFPHKSYKYDVLLSFSGEDTRKTFVDHLYVALQQQGIQTFKDDEKLQKGKSINEEILESIENSRIYIIVFSKNYASSSWCLNELVKIMECQRTNVQTAYPVFYDVDPSEVRNQRGAVGKGLAMHKYEKVGKWKEALKGAANLSGWDLRKTADGHEAKVIKLIVEHVSLELRFVNLNVDENLIGMEQRMHDLESFLEIGSNDVRMIGVKGMGGAGKTTLARAIVDKVSVHFEAKSFIENVREVSKASLSGLLSLQRQVLSDLLKHQGNNISSIHDGRNMMKKMMRDRKVLVVLDDVDHKDQLEALAGDPNWFKLGSRIIITTRDEQVLIAHRVNLIQDVRLLSNEEAIRLFSRHAFGRDIPIEKYEKQSLEVVRYAAGLPLTIKVLGSFLCGKDKLEWMDALERLKTIPLKETLKKLELSYINLEEDYKEIFLDVACFLKRWEKDKAIRLLESFGFHARNGLRVLEQKSLITTTKAFHVEFIDIHNHIEEMGKNIVRHLHLNEPSRHSRLWVQEEIEDVLASNLGTESIRCIDMRLTPEIVVEGLENMKKLRCLIVDHLNYNNDFVDRVKIDEGNQYLPNALRYLNWFRYPHWCLPKTFQGNNLVALEMHDSKIELLWEGGKVLKKLKFLELQRSKLRTLNLGIFPNLERLDLLGCYHLTELHVPVRCLKRLVYLNLRWCIRLKSFSFIKHLESLEFLNLGYLSLREFPDIILGQANNHLLELDFSSNNVEELPSSIGNFHKLVSLKLSGCKRLENLPECILSLRCLRNLHLDDCAIQEFPKGPNQLECLELLDLSNTCINHLPDSICNLKRLKTLRLRFCVILDELTEDLGQLESLEELDLSCCKIRDIPRSIYKLKRLRTLILEDYEVLELPEDLGQLKSLKKLSLRGSKIREIPDTICKLNHLKELNLYACSKLEKLPENLGDLKCLELLDVQGTSISHIPESVSLLKGLEIVGFESHGD